MLVYLHMFVMSLLSHFREGIPEDNSHGFQEACFLDELPFSVSKGQILSPPMPTRLNVLATGYL